MGIEIILYKETLASQPTEYFDKLIEHNLLLDKLQISLEINLHPFSGIYIILMNILAATSKAQ